MNRIGDTLPPPSTTENTSSGKIPTYLLMAGTAFFGYRYFTTKSGSSCKSIAATMGLVSGLALIKRLRDKP